MKQLEKREYSLEIETFRGTEEERVFDTYQDADAEYTKLLESVAVAYCSFCKYIVTVAGDVYDKEEIAGFQVTNDGEVEEW